MMIIIRFLFQKFSKVGIAVEESISIKFLYNLYMGSLKKNLYYLIIEI